MKRPIEVLHNPRWIFIRNFPCYFISFMNDHWGHICLQFMENLNKEWRKSFENTGPYAHVKMSQLRHPLYRIQSTTMTPLHVRMLVLWRPCITTVVASRQTPGGSRGGWEPPSLRRAYLVHMLSSSTNREKQLFRFICVFGYIYNFHDKFVMTSLNTKALDAIFYHP